jgi:hypothetical protein
MKKAEIKGKGTTQEIITIKPLRMEYITFTIIGTAPLIMNAFSQKARDTLAGTMTKGNTARTKKERPPKDFKADYEGHRHISDEGWDGIPVTALKGAMVRAAGNIGYVMTLSKCAFFIQSDGLDKVDLTPLIKITHGEPSPRMHYTRIQQTIDLVNRPIWAPGWEANVTIKYDSDILTKEDIANLLHRAGETVGILAGRPSSKNSVGMDCGTFVIAGQESTKKSKN